MIEVELKAKMEKSEIPNFINNIIEMGFKKIAKKKEIDTYFNGIDRDFKETDEAVRIRQSINLDTQETYYNITYKGAKIDNISKTREELEIKIDDGETAHKIFERLGFKPVSPIIKIREIYQKEEDDIIITIDEVENVGTYVEFEKVVDDLSKKEHAINELFDILKSLNISKDKLTKTSYLGLRDNNG
jgi:adenylate cyclase class 2